MESVVFRKDAYYFDSYLEGIAIL